MAVLALNHGDISPAPTDLNTGDKAFQSFCAGSVSQPRDSPLLNNNLAQGEQSGLSQYSMHVNHITTAPGT